MRLLITGLALILTAGCSSWFKPKAEPIPTPQPSESAELHQLWEKEVDDAAAAFVAIRPAIAGPESALKLYDAQLQGLISLAGQPSHALVKAKADLITLADPKAIEAIEKAKRALDAKTDAMEAKAAEADRRARAAENAAKVEAHNRRLAESASDLSRVATAAIALGFLAFLFGHLVGVPKWAAAVTVGLGVLVSTTAPQLLEFFGSDNARYIMLGTFGVLALAVSGAGAWWVLDKTRDATNKE